MRQAQFRPVSRVAGTLGALLLAAGVSACSSAHSGPTAKQGRTSPTSTPVEPVSTPALGKALDKLVWSGDTTHADGDMSCLVDAVHTAGMSNAAQAYIVKADGDDLGTVADDMRSHDKAGADLLLSPDLRQGFDACVDAVVKAHPATPSATSSTMSKVPKPKAKKSDGHKKPSKKPTNKPKSKPKSKPKPKPVPSNLKPRYKIGSSQMISSSAQVQPGLVNMFESFARNTEQKQTYQRSGACLAQAVMGAHFSQATLRFLAGGAPIGTGSVADHLPSAADKKIWNSQAFTTKLMDCTTGGSHGGSASGDDGETS